VTPVARAYRSRRVTVPAEFDCASKDTDPDESAALHTTKRCDASDPLVLTEAASLHPIGSVGSEERPPKETSTSRSPGAVPAGYESDTGPDFVEVTAAETDAKTNLGPMTTAGTEMGELGALGGCDHVSTPFRTSTGCCTYR
jgi:hypothetical protein